MTEEFNISIFGATFFLSAIQGIILAGILYFDKRYSTPSNKYIILLLLGCVNLNFIGLIYELGVLNYWIFPISFYPLIAPAAYFST